MFLDIGIGIFTAIFASYLFRVDIFAWLILFSVVCALFPDADFLYFYPKRHDTKYDHKHRDIIHYPLIYLPVGTIILWIIFGKIWAVVFFIVSFCHFLHDSIGIGWGIKWLYPFSENSYSFFYLVSKPGVRMKKKLVYTFTEEELPGIVDKYGDPNWVENVYKKWHPYAVVEMAVFIISLIALFIYVR